MKRVYKYFDEPGHLFPYDVRFDAHDLAFCERLPDGRIRLRLITEPGFTEAVVARTDGHGTPMGRHAEDARFAYWEAEVTPTGPRFDFSFALRIEGDRPVYLVPAGLTNAAERLDFWSLEVEHIPAMEVPGWVQGAVIYQIFPDRFASGDPSLTPPGADPWGSPPHSRRFQGGDLIGVAARADYLVDLGADAVYLNPIFSSPSVHRYDASDFYEVDSRLGGNEALSALVATLHERQIRVILDVSFNHCHPHFFAFQDVMARGPDSEYWDWFDVHEYPISVKYRPAAARRLYGARADHYLDYLTHTTAAAGLTLVEADDDGPPAEPTYASWYGVPTMPRLVLSNPRARQYFLEVACHWVRDYDIDGWRMDVARYIDADFWIEFRDAVKSVKPDAYLIAEIMGDAMPWLQGDRFDATMNYQFRELAVDFFARSSIDATRFVEGIIRLNARYAPGAVLANQNLLSSHDTPRFLTVAGGESARLALAVFTQMTIPGAPGLYYGDEVGMTGGEDPECRGAFPWQDPESWNQALLDQTRELGRLRKGHNALQRGDLEVVWSGQDAFAFTRCTDEERLLVVVNRGDSALELSVPISAEGAVLVWGTARLSAESGVLQVEGVPAWSGLIVSLV